MSSLTSDQLKQYEEEGYVAPIDVLSKKEAKEIRDEIELIEKKWPNELEGLGRKYIGLEPHNWVTAWVAITDANEENGCMRMWSGSHKNDLQYHNQKFDENNLLTRGQTVENVPMNETKPVILKAGQISLHHPKVVHGSGLNKSNDRRIGFVIQSYIGTNVKQVLGKMYVQQARGDDTFNYHKHVAKAYELMNQQGIKIRKKANEELSKIFYSGSQKVGKF